MKKSEILFGLLRIPTDYIMTLLAFLTAFKLRSFTKLIPGIELPLDIGTFPSSREYFGFAALAGGGLIVLFALNEMYTLKTTSRFSKELKKILILTAAWLMLMIAYFFVIRSFPFSRLVLGYTWLLSIIFIGLGRASMRLIQYQLLKKGVGKRKVAVIGESRFSKEITKTIEKNPRYELIGFITENPLFEPKPFFLGTIDNLRHIAKEYQIEEIIQAQSNLNKVKDAHIVKFCREHHIGYSFVPDLLEIQRTNIEITSVGQVPLISLKPTALDGWGRVWKRTIDIIGSIAGLMITSPIVLFSAMAMKLDSKGPVLFKKNDDGKILYRVGQHGDLFTCYKLRTMYPQTHNRRYNDLAQRNMRKNSPLIKIENDPRVTPVGRYLRRFSIDELPQFWNVLKGDMSLVGPRPHFPEEIEKYDRDQKFVLAIKPGITGLSQISGRSELDFEKEIQYDTYYIQNWSPLLDLKILAKTIGAVVKGYKE